ncbi:malto-oligosyltrehalose trehalohydrolase [Piscinibacter sakaiensis]|uniref:malto-oligosyltrehalose trehalohydrolase n=1 Tax=Piscinibacter sakaiensis TaxID=1547922 RepID=UPI003AAD89D7
MKHVHQMPFGARLESDGSAVFRLWAPSASTIELIVDGNDGSPVAMDRQPDGWHQGRLQRADAQTRYAYRVDGDLVVPDPASRHNPDDAAGASRLTDPLAFEWPDQPWTGRPWHEAVIYELHVGCFTEAGTFSAAIERLDELVALGVTAIELMPVADFPGQRGWGYDGVLHFAPDSSYGTPDDLKRLVVAAHERGLMVLLDVVYNHFGPDANYLHAYAKPFFNPDVPTPWGAAINFDAEHSETVRSFFINNVLYWIDEFRFDGLRLDAVHAMHDRSATHFIDELAQAVRNGPGRDRHVHLILENDLNDASRFAVGDDGRMLLASAQWNDDVHHAVHVIATGESDGYYIDYAREPLRLFGRALAEGFAYQGDPSEFRDGELRGSRSSHLPPLAFVNSMQTHDQVGNRAFGERIAALAAEAGRDDALRALLACVLLAPSPPMLFMGEEWAASTPFQYFCDFHGELAQAVTNGRRSEFGKFARFSDPEVRDRIPDPNAESTFRNSKLNWDERSSEPHAGWLALYTQLLKIRAEQLVPWLKDARSGSFSASEAGTLQISWPLGEGRRWHLLAQLSDAAGAADAVGKLPGSSVYRSFPASAGLAAWSVAVNIEFP